MRTKYRMVVALGCSMIEYDTRLLDHDGELETEIEDIMNKATKWGVRTKDAKLERSERAALHLDNWTKRSHQAKRRPTIRSDLHSK